MADTKHFTEDEKERIYCMFSENDMLLLKKTTRAVLGKIGFNTSDVDFPDYVSIANENLWRCCESYDKESGVEFFGFFCICLRKKFKTEIRDRVRLKRKVNCIAELFEDFFDENNENLKTLYKYDEAFKYDLREQLSQKTFYFFYELSSTQQRILKMRMIGFKDKEIQYKLNLSRLQFNNNVQAVKMMAVLRKIY